MTDKVAIVTGGALGIGKACCLRFAKEGFKVVIASRTEVDGLATCQLIKDSGGDAVFCLGDVSRESDCQAFADAALKAYGRIDVLVANAGARVRGTILESTEADWDYIVGVNLKGVVYSCKAVLPTMIARHSGSIVIVSSINALVGRGNMSLYDMTKAGELSLTRSMAVDFGKDGIRVNTICPGYTMTDFHERAAARRGVTPAQLRENNKDYGLLHSAVEPSQIASTVYFMASDDASCVTGQYLMVDNGLSVVSGNH